MNQKQLRTEISRLRRILSAAAKKAEENRTLIDKLTAAQLQVDLLMKRLRRSHRRRSRPAARSGT